MSASKDRKIREMHAEIERLTAERDEALNTLQEMGAQINALHASDGRLIEKLTRVVAERDQARAQFEHAVNLLCGIHALLYPPPLSVSGRVMVFRPDGLDPHLILQELSDRIRALPAELEKIAAALQQPKEPSNG